MFWSEVLQRCTLPASYQCRLLRTINPGVSRRLKIFKQENPDLNKMKIGERDVDDLEMDVANAGLLMKDYQKEHVKVSKRIEFKRVERSYFDKIENLNFLLWSEKEQIRQLHESQPDKWTYERLSESFPATPDVIKKIVKAQWKMRNSNSIEKHDSRVFANWKLFHEGKLELRPRLSAHLSKFTTRDRSLMAKVATFDGAGQSNHTDVVIAEEENKVKDSASRISEFADIIRNYAKREDNFSAATSGTVSSNSMPSKPGETYVLNIGNERVKKRVQHFTLSEMRKSGKIVSTQSELLHHPPQEGVDSVLDSTKADRHKGVINPSVNFSLPQRSYAGSQNVVATDHPPEEIAMKITIPKNKWKKGAVYKVNNCFYADDGEFLYKI